MDMEELYRAHVASLTDRVSLALERAGFERVVIHAGDLVSQSRFDDLEWPFRPVPAFAHWVAWPWPGSAVVLEKGRAARLLARRRTDFWEKPEAPHASLMRKGIEVEEVDDLSVLGDLIRRPGSAFIGEAAAAGVRLGFEEEALNPHRLVRELHETRVHKTPYEVACMAQANRRAARGHHAIRDAFLNGERSELALHLIYLSASEQDDADAPYKNIVALGEAGAILHHHVYGRRPDARSLLVDAGASFQGYAADITRTHAAADADPRFAGLIEAMERLQLTVIDRITPGQNYEELHDEAHQLLAGVLVEHDLVSCSAEAAVNQGLTRVFFPHGLGHSIGVQVHDVGCRERQPRKENEFLRNTREIDAGQVFTVEPGLYFIDALLDPLRDRSAGEAINWAVVDPLRPYGGIRIEDDVHVLSSEHRVRNLSREALNAS